MNKDVIYIDTEDDITAIIGKIKDSKEKIVALVPPKRTGILQSSVNLRLLARMAENSNKHLVIITSSDALIALSASASIPVAKNLQSKPEIAEIAALEVDDGDDVIDGAQLPIGELARTTDLKQDDDVTEVIDTIDIEDESLKSSKTSSKSNVKVPDFPRFRRKLFLGVTLAIILGVFLVWATQYAPAARVIITAKTSPAPVSVAVKLGGTEATDVKKNIIQTVSQQIIKDVSVEFDATGKKDIGEKATGTITVRNCDYSDGFTLPLGTEFINNDLIYTSTMAVSIPKFTGLSTACDLSGKSSGKAIVSVQASVNGETYDNTNAGVSYDIDSISVNAKVDAIGSAMTGGTTKMVTIVVAADVQKASQVLVDLSSDSVKQQLISQFTNGESVIADSFNIERAEAVSVPAIGAEVAGKAKLTSQTTYSITAIAKSELKSYLADALNKQISDTNKQRVYNDGIDKVVLSGYLKTDKGATVNIATIGQIGPNIDEASIKEQVKGKRYGDIQSLIGAIEGVNDVDTKFSYFWVYTVPNDISKIIVEFRLENA
ncbi:MAG TPA: hypothetical protein VFD55_02385 [Candidatus Angelobacter sp.]|nr:hypothetical protein [Candidatus Angelobacter sp.]